MFILINENHKGTKPSYYCGMISGLIVEISEDISKAKQFNNEVDCQLEWNKYKFAIRDFICVDYGIYNWAKVAT